MRDNISEKEFRSYQRRVMNAIIKTGMTTSEVAKKMNCKRGTVYGGDRHMMNAYTLIKFCMVTGASADYILGLTKDET